MRQTIFFYNLLIRTARDEEVHFVEQLHQTDDPASFQALAATQPSPDCRKGMAMPGTHLQTKK